MRVDVFCKRIGLLAGALLFLSACESIPPNTISPEVRDTLRVSDIQVAVTDQWRTTLNDEALKKANRRAEKKYEEDLLRARTRKKKALVEKEEVDTAKVKSDVNVGIQEMTDMVKTKLQENFAEFQSGNRPVRIDAVLSSYSAANAGEIILFGGSERISGSASVIDLGTNKPLAIYGINIVIQNQGGIIAAMLDAAFFGDKTKRLSGLFADAVEGRFKANTYQPGAELALEQQSAPGMAAPAATPPADTGTTPIETAPASQSTPPEEMDADEALDQPVVPLVDAPSESSPDLPVAAVDDPLPEDATSTQIDATMPSVDSSAQDALWRKRQEALSQGTQ